MRAINGFVRKRSMTICLNESPILIYEVFMFSKAQKEPPQTTHDNLSPVYIVLCRTASCALVHSSPLLILSVVHNSSKEETPVIFVFYQTATDWPWLSSGTPKILIIKFFTH